MILSFNNYENIIFNDCEDIVYLITKIIFKEFNIKKNYIVEVNIFGNKKMRELNYKFRKINQATDVLSFLFLEKTIFFNNKVPQILGEIDISGVEIEQQAKKNKCSIFYAFCYLYIHGLLHLLGFDHIKSNDADLMFKKQEYFLNKLCKGKKYKNLNEIWFC